MSKRRGFALIEILICILTVCICIPITVQVLSIVRSVLKDKTPLQDQIALVQLRHYLAVAYDIELEPTTISFLHVVFEMKS